MILKKTTLKSYKCLGETEDINKHFFIDGKNFDDCFEQLMNYCKENPKKWVYVSNLGSGVAIDIPVCRNNFEVKVFDKEPTSIMIGWEKVQEGSEGLREIDFLSEEEKTNLKKKQLNALYGLMSF